MGRLTASCGLPVAVALAAVAARGEADGDLQVLGLGEEGEELVAKLGAHRLKDFAKVHFKTAYEVLGLPVPEKPSFYKR
mgnify:CR=1 FL=1